MNARLPYFVAIANLARRPVRSLLIALSAALVAGVLVASTAFVTAIHSSHVATAPARTAIVLSTNAEGDILRSTVSLATGDLLAAEVRGVVRTNGVQAVSPEIHMGTDVFVDGDDTARQGFVRGVTERAFLVHDAVTLIEGRLPGPGEALVGRLAASKCGVDDDAFGIGRGLTLEGGRFVVSGTFAAPATVIESEIWVGLSELQGLSKRDDASCVFVRTESEDDLIDVELFALRRLDLEIRSISAASYYAELASYFKPILALSWAMAALIALAALTGGANTLVASVQDRTRELAALRAVGYRGGALTILLLEEALTLGAIGALCGVAAAQAVLGRVSISLAMTAFRLEVDARSIVVGLIGVFIVLVAGTVPALVRILRLPVAAALRHT